jgi:hypothetical protein
MIVCMTAQRAGDDRAAEELLPVERAYPLPDDVTAIIGDFR